MARTPAARDADAMQLRATIAPGARPFRYRAASTQRRLGGVEAEQHLERSLRIGGGRIDSLSAGACGPQ